MNGNQIIFVTVLFIVLVIVQICIVVWIHDTSKNTKEINKNLERLLEKNGIEPYDSSNPQYQNETSPSAKRQSLNR